MRGLTSSLSQSMPILLTLLFAGVTYWLALQSELELLGQRTTLDPELPDYYFEGFRTERHQVAEGETLILNGQQAQHIPSGDEIRMEVVRSVQYLPNSTVSHLTADKGVYGLDTEILDLSGGVQVTRKAPDKTTLIESETLRVNNDTQIVSSQDKTEIRQPGRYYVSSGFKMNNRTGQFSADGSVRVILQPKS